MAAQPNPAAGSDLVIVFDTKDEAEAMVVQGLLESALAQPESTMFGVFLHADLWEQAAAYAFHIAENQPFIDGNKRVAVAAALRPGPRPLPHR